MKQILKRCFAMGLSFAMALTMLPLSGSETVKAEGTSPALLAAYDFADANVDGTTIKDTSGNEKNAVLKGTGGTIADGALMLPGGNAGSDAAYVEIPKEVFVGKDTLTINIWLKNETGPENYAAMSFGTTTQHIGGGTGNYPVNYWLLNPAQPDGKFKSVWTKSDNAGGPWGTETKISETKTDNNWRMYTTVITPDSITGYYDGQEVCKDSKTKTTTEFGENLIALIGRSGYNDKFYKGGVYGVKVYEGALSQQEIQGLYEEGAAWADAKELDLGDLSEVKENITLPTAGSRDTVISWSSSNPSIISDAGVVTRPSGEYDEKVTLTATVGKGEKPVQKTFTVNVLTASDKGKFKDIMKAFALDFSVVTGDVALPSCIDENKYTTVTWTSDKPEILSIDAQGTEIKGVVKVPEKNEMVTLTAAVDYKHDTLEYSETKAFRVVVRTAPVVSKTAAASYDFADYAANGDVLKGKDNTEIKLESVGSGKKPELAQDKNRGQVLSLTRQDYNARGFALLPSNPFAGKSVENGFTLNFWTKSTGSAEGNRCLVDFEVAPATDKRAGTFAVNQKMVYWNTTDQNAKFTDFNIDKMNLAAENGWTMVTVAVTKTGIAFYSNGKKISHNITSGAEDYAQMIGDLAGTSGICDDPAKTNVRLGASLATYWHCAGALMDDVSFYEKELSADEVAVLYDETMVPVDIESVSITGSSEVDEDASIMLSASVLPVDATVDRTVTWKSSDESILKINANGRARGVKPGTAEVTATVAGKDSAPFSITVKALATGFQPELQAGRYLAVYSTTTPFYAAASNVEQETRSVYMAVSENGKDFTVLNNGGGVIFSKNTSGTLQITKPRIKKDADGKFAVIAPDIAEAKGYHIFTSSDGVKYYDDTLEKTNSDYASIAPLRKSGINLMLNGENILDIDETITLGNAVELTEAEYKYIVDKLGTVVNTGLEELQALKIKGTDSMTEQVLAEKYPSVNASYSDGSTQKFNIDWSGSLAGLDLTKAGTYTVTGKVVQTKYLNNLKQLNNSSLPDDDPGNANPAFPGNYDPQTGSVYYDQTKFIEGMADPFIYWDEQTQYYYMTASYFPEEGDQIDANDNTQQYDRIVLRRGKTLEDLQTRANQVTIWKAGNQGYEDNGTSKPSGYRYIWAPEIHRVGSKWVIYFTESQDPNSVWNIYCHALVLDGSKDPYETALKASNQESEWKDYKMCASSAVTGGTIDEIPQDPFSLSFCLDMTYFKDKVNGKSYVIWAGHPTAAYQGGSTDLFIAEVDEEQPWMITSRASRLTKSDYGWERIRYCVNEGATTLQKDGNIFLAYSVSGTGSEYAIGMLNAKGGEDLLNINNWTKSPYPLLTSRDVNGEEGPGHNSFTVDKDGNDIFVYHARPTSHNYQKCGKYNSEPLNDPCRHARLKRVHWAADGTPILKMTYENELLSENETVKLTVVVEETVKSITLNEKKVTLGEKEKFQLKATVKPSGAKVTWQTSSKKIASVSSKGLVTAIKSGVVKIKATAGGKSVICTVTVKKAPSKVSVKPTGASLRKGKSFQIKVTLPKNTASNKITFASSNSKVAAVSSSGKVTAKKSGKATITVKTFNNKKATVKVTVK